MLGYLDFKRVSKDRQLTSTGGKSCSPKSTCPLYQAEICSDRSIPLCYKHPQGRSGWYKRLRVRTLSCHWQDWKGHRGRRGVGPRAWLYGVKRYFSEEFTIFDSTVEHE